MSLNIPMDSSGIIDGSPYGVYRPSWSDHSLNPGVPWVKCGQSLLSMTPEEKSSNIAMEKSVSKMASMYAGSVPPMKWAHLAVQDSVRRFMGKSSFFNGEMAEAKAEAKAKSVFTEVYEDNPEQITDPANDKEVDEQLDDPNSINKRLMTDTGAADFDYQPAEPDQIGLVQETNTSYTIARDKYFIPEQGKPDAPGAKQPKPMAFDKGFWESLQMQAMESKKQGKRLA